jgi:WD40-like Beta Propeller Repeat
VIAEPNCEIQRQRSGEGKQIVASVLRLATLEVGSMRLGQAVAIGVSVIAALAGLAGSGARHALAEADHPAIGVGLTPAHFPRSTPDDVVRMIDLARQVGSYGQVTVPWRDPGAIRIAGALLPQMASRRLTSIVALNILDGTNGRLELPPGVTGRSMAEAAVARAYQSTVRELAALGPDYLSLAGDINLLLANGPDLYVQFVQVYKQAYRAAKAASPKTKVFVTFSWDFFRTASEQHPLSALAKLLDLFRPDLDALAFSSQPTRYHEPAMIPADYFGAIKQFVSPREESLLQVGWPSSGSRGEALQRAFVERLSGLAAGAKPNILIWSLLHDVGDSGPLAGLGLYTSAGTAKPAAASFAAVAGAPRPPAPTPAPAATPPAQTAASVTAQAGSARGFNRREESDKFSIFTSTLSGGRRTLIFSDPKREVNHARVSPDGSRVVFTRYNTFNRDGEALETGGYRDTETIICQIDGSGCEVAITPRKGFAAANAYWTPDGKKLLFVSDDMANGHPAIKSFDLATREIAPFYAPSDIAPADPHQTGGAMVVVGRPRNDLHLNHLYIVDLASKTRRQISTTRLRNPKKLEPPVGYHDPKLSPDGKSVAVMRQSEEGLWSIAVVDVATGAERNLTPAGTGDAVPEWSSDGKLIIFWSVDFRNLKEANLVTARPDGSERKDVPLPTGRFYTMPAFFPGDGSGPASRIIYSRKQ